MSVKTPWREKIGVAILVAQELARRAIPLLIVLMFLIAILMVAWIGLSLAEGIG
jgi:hypothetical protein